MSPPYEPGQLNGCYAWSDTVEAVSLMFTLVVQMDVKNTPIFHLVTFSRSSRKCRSSGMLFYVLLLAHYLLHTH